MFFFYEHTLHKIPCQEKWQENVKKLSIERHGILFSTHLCHVLLFWAVGYGRMPDRSIRDASTARKRHGAGKLRRRKGEEPDRERGRQAFGLRTQREPSGDRPCFMGAEPQKDAPTSTSRPWGKDTNQTRANALPPFAGPSEDITRRHTAAPFRLSALPP